MDMLNIKVNGMAIEAPKGTTVLEAARLAGVEIPTLCFLKEINEIGACRICVSEVAEMRGPALGPKRLVASCVFPISQGMEIYTNSPKVIAARRQTLRAYSFHP